LGNTNNNIFPDITPDPIFFGPGEPVSYDISEILSEMGKKKASATLFRDEIIREIFSILISENKPNALLVGSAGCGKTNIVEELSKRIRRKSKYVPHQLYGYKVYSLNLSDIVSGCGIVGELERKVRKLVDYLEADEHKAILFLDEVHMLFASESYNKVAQILKPALSRGKFMVIAATTTQEVKRIDEDPAFNRRFTRVLVDELNKEQTIKVLQKTVKGMEKHYGISINFDQNIASLIVRTADEFCTVGSHRPDNAITLMDRAVAARIISLQSMDSETPIILDEKHVQDTAFRMTSGSSSVKKFDEKSFLKAVSKIRGQDDILQDITKTLKLYDMHLRPRKKPLTFLFAGPSGVGKTEVAKIIAREYICEKPIILNMAEYNSSASINRIIGSPQGYEGSDSTRELPFDALDTNPYQVILLDEFEKCDRSVQRLFMSAFDEGTMKTNLGKEIDFSKTIIIATTNAGCTAGTGNIGFGSADRDTELTTSDLSAFFDVELLNRFSKRLSFHGIDEATYYHIVRDNLETETAELKDGRFGRAVSEFMDGYISASDIESIVADSFDPKLGARPAQSAVREYVDGKILELISKPDVKKRLKANDDSGAGNYEYNYVKGVMPVA
jgi:ATP-dependent Clp protease ATP-binding subunit ClpA